MNQQEYDARKKELDNRLIVLKVDTEASLVVYEELMQRHAQYEKDKAELTKKVTELEQRHSELRQAYTELYSNRDKGVVL